MPPSTSHMCRFTMLCVNENQAAPPVGARGAHGDSRKHPRTHAPCRESAGSELLHGSFTGRLGPEVNDRVQRKQISFLNGVCCGCVLNRTCSGKTVLCCVCYAGCDPCVSGARARSLCFANVGHVVSDVRCMHCVHEHRVRANGGLW